MKGRGRWRKESYSARVSGVNGRVRCEWPVGRVNEWR